MGGTRIPLTAIRTDGGTQPRAVVDFPTVEEYTDAMARGVRFPPVVVFYDGSAYWLADGFHRLAATSGAGLQEIDCDVQQGTMEDAQWYSFAANKTNGLRRTNEDKQRAVKAALAHAKAAGLSDAVIASHVGVSDRTVAEYRKAATPKISESAVRTGRDGRTINVVNIGKAKRVPAATTVALGVNEAEKVVRPPDKRQQVLANAGRDRMISTLSTVKGMCDGLHTINISSCSPDDRKAFGDIARTAARELRDFAARLETEQAGTEPKKSLPEFLTVSTTKNYHDSGD